jgi:hypothetical protein
MKNFGAEGGRRVVCSHIYNYLSKSDREGVP